MFPFALASRPVRPIPSPLCRVFALERSGTPQQSAASSDQGTPNYTRAVTQLFHRPRKQVFEGGVGRKITVRVSSSSKPRAERKLPEPGEAQLLRESGVLLRPEHKPPSRWLRRGPHRQSQLRRIPRQQSRPRPQCVVPAELRHQLRACRIQDSTREREETPGRPQCFPDREY